MELKVGWGIRSIEGEFGEVDCCRCAKKFRAAWCEKEAGGPR